MLFAGQVVTLLFFVFASRIRQVASFSFSVTALQQCGPFNVNFEGTPSIQDLPLTLTIVPADSTSPLSILIPNTAIQNAGFSVSFLPYVAGTNVVLSIDNVFNQTVKSVSKIFQILPSSTKNSSCLSTPTLDERYYTIPDSYTQCRQFNVTYNSSVITQPPTIRLFKPDGPSFNLNMTSTPAAGIATYEMSATYNSSVILLLDDHSGHYRTTPIVNVGGTSASDASCVPTRLLQQHTAIPSPKLSKLGFAVIAGVISGVVMVVLLLMAVYLYAERRRRRSIPIQYEDDWDHQSVNKGVPPTPIRPSRIGIPALFSSRQTLHQSPKTSLQSHNNDQSSSLASRTRIRSLEPRPDTPSAYSNLSDSKEWEMVTDPPMVKLVYSRTPQLQRSSLTSLDIEDMLNSATIYNAKDDDVMSYSGSTAFRVPPPASFGAAKRPSVVTNPPPRRYNTRGQLLDRWSKKPDVPTDSYPRLSTASYFSSVIPPLPPPRPLNRRMQRFNQAMSPLASTPVSEMRRLSADAGPLPSQTPSNRVLSWQEGRIPMSGESRSKDSRYFSRPLGGIIQGGYAI